MARHKEKLRDRILRQLKTYGSLPKSMILQSVLPRAEVQTELEALVTEGLLSTTTRQDGARVVIIYNYVEATESDPPVAAAR